MASLKENTPTNFFSFKEDADSVKVVFDAKRVPSKAEPFGFVNKVRPMHGVDVDSAPGYSATSVNFTVTTTSDPRDWIEFTNSSDDYYLKFRDPATGAIRATATGDLLVKVTALTAGSIDCEIVSGLGSNLTSQDEILLTPVFGPEYESSLYGGPVLILPIENAFAGFTAHGQTVTYVNFPNYENGETRTEGNSQIPTHPSIHPPGKRADEYITYLLSNLLTQPGLEISQRPVNAVGDVAIDSVFTTAIKKSGDGF